MNKMLTTVLVFAISYSAFSKTIVWYHFDEAAPDATFAGHEIINAVNPGTLNGVVYSIASTTFTANDDRGYGAHGTTAFISPLAVLDPESGNVIENERAFVTSQTRSATTGFGGYGGGAVRFKNDETPRWGSFTAEAFVQVPQPMASFLTSNATHKNYGHPIFGIGSSATGKNMTWSLQYYRGNFWLRATGATPGSVVSSAIMNDFKWHHVAVTVDNSSGTSTVLTLFVDYVQIGSIALASSTLDYANASYPFTIGADPGLASTGKFCGIIDEFRVSDEVLTTDRFLRMVKKSEAPSDVISWWSMEEWGSGYDDYSKLATVTGPYDRKRDFGGWTLTRMLFGGSAGTTQGKYDASSFVQSEIYVDRTGNPQTVTDAGSYLTVIDDPVTQTSWQQASYLKVTQESVGDLTGDDFTLEFYFKANGSNLVGGNSTILMVPTSGSTLKIPVPALQLYIESNGQLSTAFTPASGTTEYHSITGDGVRVDDSKWHHVAVVYDKANAMLRFYCDRRLGQTAENVTLSECLNEFVIGAKGTMWNNNYGFAGWLDEFRITRCALDKERFMSLDPKRGIAIIVR